MTATLHPCLKRKYGNDEFLFANRGDKYQGAFQDYMAFDLATPEQISRAALKTLAEHRSK